MKAALYLMIVWASTAFALSAQAGSFDACLSMFPGASVPTAQSTPQSMSVQDLCVDADGQMIFAVRFDTARKTPSWTAHSLSPAQMAMINANAGTMKRPRFTPTPDLPVDAQAVDRSYVRSGYSRGHIVPAHDMSWRKAAYDATFRFSNVVPQKQAFNAGPWLGAEDAFRRYVRAKNLTLWNFSGVYGQVEAAPTIGKAPNAPAVPKCYFKIFAAQQGRERPYKVLALIFAWNDFGKRTSWVNAATTLALLEARSGIDFFTGLTVEDGYDAAFWGLDMPSNPADCA